MAEIVKTEEPIQTKLEDVFEEALAAADSLELEGERADAVRLAVKTLLVIRSGLHPSLFKKAQRGGKIFDPYPIIAKYIRASNAETLGGLVDDTLRNISPDFVARNSAGIAVADLFSGGEIEQTSVTLLKTETIPIVMLMKALYKQARGFDEVDQLNLEEKAE